jgi:hypothetical protein
VPHFEGAGGRRVGIDGEEEVEEEAFGAVAGGGKHGGLSVAGGFRSFGPAGFGEQASGFGRVRCGQALEVRFEFGPADGFDDEALPVLEAVPLFADADAGIDGAGVVGSEADAGGVVDGEGFAGDGAKRT